MEELETGLVPQAQAQPVAGLFGDQRIFVSALQYQWHVQGVVSADNEAKHHIKCLDIEVASVWSLHKRKRNGIVAQAE